MKPDNPIDERFGWYKGIPVWHGLETPGYYAYVNATRVYGQTVAKLREKINEQLDLIRIRDDAGRKGGTANKSAGA